MKLWQRGVVVVLVVLGSDQPARSQDERIVQMDTLNVRDVLYHLGEARVTGLR